LSVSPTLAIDEVARQLRGQVLELGETIRAEVADA
jgi:hypothetical protein